MTIVDPSPVSNLNAAAHAVDARRKRSRQKRLGPSSIGGCRRRAGYAIAGVAASDDEGSKMAAILGTWIHKGALTALKSEFGAAIEVPLGLPDSPTKGSTDAVFVDSLTVEDVKTVGRFAFDWRVERGPGDDHLFQAHIYAWLLRTGQIPPAGRRKLFAAGWTAPVDLPTDAVEWRIPITQIVIRYVCRDTGEEWPYVDDYNPEITRQALEWLAELHDQVESVGVDEVPRDHDGPGLSKICDGCKFRTLCWGPQPKVGDVQSNLVVDDADTAAALEEYAHFRKIESDAKNAKALARAKLTGSVAAVYGGYELSWTGEDRPAGSTEVPDVDAMVAAYKAADLEVPMISKATRAGSRTIGVKKAKAANVPVVG